MRAYVIRRLLLLIPTLLLLSILVFLSVRFIPGDVIDTMAGRLEAMGAGANIDREAVERMLGLDQPVYVQYGRWMGGILLRGTLGNSLLGDWSIGRGGYWGQITADYRAWRFVRRHGVADSSAGRHLLGDAPQHRRRLRGAFIRRHRLGNAQLLAGPDGHDLPCHLVGLVAADGVYPSCRGPAGKSRHLHHTQPDTGDGACLRPPCA